jgi:EmrB/QacA subfamily drug resistance transporter
MSTLTAPAPAIRQEHLGLRTKSGVLILLLMCAIQFMDVADTSIVNVALPSIQHSLGFSQQNLQWVASGYILTYGSFLLLGGRAADLLGRRRVLVAGLIWFAVCSLAGGLAYSQGLLIAARIAQGIGAAIMAPAALSILTTSFSEGKDRNTALGVWGAIAAIGGAAGVSLGGFLSEGPGWRWVLFVNLPVVLVCLAATFRLLPADHQHAPGGEFDLQGALLVTGGLLLLVFALVRAPEVGWGSTQTVLELVGAAVVLAGFALVELRSHNPLFPFSILRVKGLPAANVVQLVAFAGFLAMFFFVTLYLQEVLRFSPIQAGLAYLPVTAAFGVSAAIGSQLIARIGTRPVVAGGSLIAAGGIYWLSLVPVHGTYAGNVLPGLLLMPFGAGAVFVGVTIAANAGVPEHQAGLAAALLNAARQVGSALGLAIFSAIATSSTVHLLAAHAPKAAALTGGYQRALLASSIFVLAAAIIALRVSHTRDSGSAPDSARSLAAPASEARGIDSEDLAVAGLSGSRTC